MPLNNPLPLAPLTEPFVDAYADGAVAVDRRMPARVLLLFGADWDAHLLPRYERSGRYRFHTHGFDLFSFPSNAQLMWFDLWRFVERLVERYRGRIDAVFSSNEQFGALAAALVAERLGLPGAKPASILRAQHKYESRLRLAEAVPDLVPPCRLVPYDLTLADARRLHYPLFVKPVKATFSVLARRCDTPQQLVEHLRFRPWEKHIIQRLIAPHDQALQRFPEFRIGTQHLVVEPVLAGRQINVDGFVHGGNVHLLGVTDELMYPGTMSFLRFQFPGAASSAGLASRVRDAAERTMRALELDHGFFNLEFFVDEETEQLTLIEVNPRLAAQLAQFYEWVLGIDTYELGFAMALDRPLPFARPARWGAAASFVWRSFDGTSCPRLPTRDDRAWLARVYPEARLELYPKRGAALQRDIKWLGSHRWAILNMPGRDADDLRRRYELICERLRWPAPY
jgi:hypothetical protein